MSTLSRVFRGLNQPVRVSAALRLCGFAFLCAGVAVAADAPKDAALTQAGSAPVAGTQLDNLEFSGVSTVGKKTMINLFDKVEKRNFWIEAGMSSGGLTIAKYDNAKDQVLVKQGGTEKWLPLRAPGAVINGTAAPIAASAPTAGAPTGAIASPTPTPSTTPMTQARQEEEARMLVSDLLEIGMAQRRAYEEAQRKAAAANGGTTQNDPNAPAPAPAAQPAAPDNTTQAAAAGTPTVTPTTK